MRLLFVIPDLAPATGGPVTAVKGLARALAAQGHKVAIATTDFGLAGPPEVERVRVHLFPCRLAGRRWAPGLWSFLQEQVGRYDLVSLHTLWQYSTWAAGLACRRARVPYVVTAHKMLDAWSLAQKARRKWLYLGLAEGETLRGAAAIWMTSEGERRSSRPERWNRSVFVLPWGLDRSAWLDLPDPSSFTRRYPAVGQ